MFDLINNCKVKDKIFIVITTLERENQSEMIVKLYYFLCIFIRIAFHI